jgi:hypothetical protein
MKTSFSFRQTGLILKADWIERGKIFMIMLATMLIAWLLILWAISYDPSGSKTSGCMTLLGLIAMYRFCKHAGRKLHETKGNFLILPASAEEKYAALIAEGIIYLIAFQAVCWLGIIIGILLFPDTVNNMGETASFLGGNIISFVFFTTLMLYFRMTFRKYSILLLIIGISAYALINLYIFMRIGFYAFGPFTMTVHDNGDVSTGGNDIALHVHGAITQAVQITNDIMPYALAIASAVILYLVYLKIKEKEIR